ncbi:MAG TPA: protoporphyrinogen oxidase [Candidatus Cybelea sp.]|nr:protoporphyrinogen oxidase [Candidatus Cybelea sp.]
MPEATHIVVIGAGISGLACAYRLKCLGARVTLLESSGQAGGLIATVDRDGFLFESGPQSFQGTPALLGLVGELGIEGELVEADPRAPRYVLRSGRLEKIPMSPPALVRSSLLGVGSRWRIVSEPFRHSKPPSGEESVADFVRRKFGQEILEYLVSPFVSGVYAGDPEKLSLRAAFPTLDEWERQFGSIVRGAIKARPASGEGGRAASLCSFRGGLRTLVRALGKSLGDSLETGSCVASLSPRRQGERGYDVDVSGNGRNETIAASAAVLATPAYVAARLIRPVSPSLAQTLSGIPYAPVAVAAAGYYARQFAETPNGFGFLVPRSEGLRTLGTVWNSSLFAGRAPAGCVTITSFLGGATDPEVVEKPDEEIAALANKENRRISAIEGLPVVSLTWRHPKALPQYNLGHGHIVRELREAQERVPGVYFAGNYLEGPAIGKCVEQAFRTAEAADAYARRRT